MHLLHVAHPDSEALPALLQTPAGKYQATVKGMQKLVGIICDTRVLGEANHRPSIRLPPIDFQTVQALLNATRQRHTDSDRLHPDDLYLTLTGGRDLPKINGWLAKQNTKEAAVSTRSVSVHLKQESVVSRFSRVRGVCSAKTCEVLKLTAQPWPAGRLRTRRWLHYEGTT